jgi:hypothetical protein
LLQDICKRYIITMNDKNRTVFYHGRGILIGEVERSKYIVNKKFFNDDSL